MPRNKLRSAKEDALNEVEAGMLLNACRDLLDNLVVRLPLYAGLRIGEVQHLKKLWLDWEKDIIIIPARQQCSCYECRKWRKSIWTPKTKAGQRSLLIVPELEPYLRQQVSLYLGGACSHCSVSDCTCYCPHIQARADYSQKKALTKWNQ